MAGKTVVAQRRRRVASQRLRGQQLAEIARAEGVSKRTVERDLAVLGDLLADGADLTPPMQELPLPMALDTEESSQSGDQLSHLGVRLESSAPTLDELLTRLGADPGSADCPAGSAAWWAKQDRRQAAARRAMADKLSAHLASLISLAGATDSPTAPAAAGTAPTPPEGQPEGQEEV